MKKRTSFHNNNSGFILADFLFSIVLVLSSCIILFTLCFSLASVELAQYITWSSARSYSSANLTEVASVQSGKMKFARLSAMFPLLTGQGAADTSWFELNLKDVGNNTALIADLQQININNALASGEPRQPWTGAATELDVSLFRRLRLPFIGALSTDDEAFKYRLRAFILRNPSQEECLGFFQKKYNEGISKIEGSWNSKTFMTTKDTDFFPQEDNGC